MTSCWKLKYKMVSGVKRTVFIKSSLSSNYFNQVRELILLKLEYGLDLSLWYYFQLYISNT